MEDYLHKITHLVLLKEHFALNDIAVLSFEYELIKYPFFNTDNFQLSLHPNKKENYRIKER